MVYKIDRYLNYCLYASAVIRDVARSKGCKTRQSQSQFNFKFKFNNSFYQCTK